MSMESNLILALFEVHVRVLQALVNAKVERKVTLADPTAKIREPLEKAHSIDRS